MLLWKQGSHFLSSSSISSVGSVTLSEGNFWSED